MSTARNIPVMTVTAALNVGSVMLWNPILSLIMRDLGASDLQISVAFAAWALAAAFSQYQGGRWGDRFGRFPIVVYPTYLCALAIGTAAFMPSWLPFAIVYVFWNAFNALQSPVFMPFVGESVPPERRGHAFGLLEGVIAVGIVIGPLLGARLLPAIGARGLFLITAAVIMSTATVRHLLLRETRPKATGSRPFAFSHIFSGRLRLVLLSLVLSNVVLVMANWGPFMSLHASDAMGLSKAQINLFFALGAAVGAASSPLGGRAVARFGPHRVLALACLGLGLCALLWMVQRNLAGIALGYLLINFFFQWGVISNDAFRVHAVDESIRGVCLGSMGTLVSLSTVVVVPLVGFLKQLLPTAPFWMATVAAVGLLVVTNALTRADATEPAGLTAAE